MVLKLEEVKKSFRNSEELVPVRFAPVKSTDLKSTPLKLELLKLAPYSSA